MTVASTTNKVSYTATASQTTFAYTFKIFADADLKVYVNDVLKTLTTDYTVTNAGVTGGGNVIFGTGRTASEIITIERVITATQLTDYVENDPFAAETHENALDKLTMLAQQNESASNNSVRAPTTDVNPNMLLDKAATRATKMLGFDADGDPVMSASTVDEIDASVAAALATGILASAYQFTGDGTTVDFTLAGGITDIPNSQSIIVDIDGVTQHTDTYTVSGKVVTFSVAPPLNGDIQVRYNAYLGDALVSDFTETIVTMKALSPAVNSSINLLGYHARGDGGGGVFYWDATSTATDNGGTIIKAAPTTGRWIRVYSGAVNVKWFGATGDGVTDDVLAIQAAIDLKVDNGAIFIPTGVFIVSTSLTITGIHFTVCGEGQYKSIVKGSVDNAYSIFKVGTNAGGETWGQYGNVTFENFQINGNKSVGADVATSIGIDCLWTAHIRINMMRILNTRGHGVHFYTGGYSSITKSNINTHGISGIFLDGVNSTNSITSTLIQDCQISTNGTYAVHAKNFFNVSIMNNVMEDIGTGGVGATIKLEGSALRNMVIKHNYFEANNDAAYDIDFSGVGIQGLSISDNWLAGTPATSTYNTASATIVNGNVNDNEGGDAISALDDVVGIRSIELNGVVKTATSAELTTATTGGLSVDTTSLLIGSAGTWTVTGVLQVDDAGSLALTSTGIYLTNTAGQPGNQTATNVNFKSGSDFKFGSGAGDKSHRLQAQITLTVTSATTIYLATYLNISAGTIAYKGELKAVRMA